MVDTGINDVTLTNSFAETVKINLPLCGKQNLLILFLPY